MNEGMATTGWDVNEVEGAMYDIPKMYIKIEDRTELRRFFNNHKGYAVYVWQVCHYTRFEFPFDTRIELCAHENCLVMEIHPTPDYIDKAIEKVEYAASKAVCSAAELDKTWNKDTSLFSFTIL